MAEQENEETAQLRPACVACTYHCNKIHGDRDLEEEKFDPERCRPFFRKKMSKLSLHHTPQAGICIPGAFMEDYPNTFQKGKFITLEGPSGNKWRVAAVDRSILHLGWRAFAHDHRLREGDILNFNLTKPSHFLVDIFNSNGEVRRSALNARVTGKYSLAPRTPLLQDRSRKRKEIETTSVPTIPDRCKATSKRGNFNVEHTMGPRLKFCERTKQWANHEERDARREVVNLDSDDEEPKIRQVKRLEMSSKIERLVEFMREEEENGFLPESTPPAIQVVNLTGEDHHVVEKSSHEDIPGDGAENHVAHEQPGDDDSLDEENETVSNPLLQFTTMFDTRPRKATKDHLKVDKPAIQVKNENLDTESDPLSRQAQINTCDEDTVMMKAASDPLSRQAQVSCDQDTVMMKEEQLQAEDSTHLVMVALHSDDVEIDKPLTNTRAGAAHVAMSSLLNSSPQPHTIEDRTTADRVDEPRLKAPSTNPNVEDFSTISPNNILSSSMEAYQKTIQGISENKFSTAAASNNSVLESYKINPIAQAAADHYEPMTNKAGAHANPSLVTLPTSTSEMSEMYESKLSTLNSMTNDIKIDLVNISRLQGQVQEAGELSSEKLENSLNVPVSTDTTNDGEHPLKVGLISQELAKELDTLKLNEEEFLKHLTKSINTTHEELCMSSSATLHDSPFYVTKTEPEENPSTLPGSENTKVNENLPSANAVAPQTRNEENSPAINTPATGRDLELKTSNEGSDAVKKQTAKVSVTAGHRQRILELSKELNISDPEQVIPDAAQVKAKCFNIEAKSMIKTDTDTCVLISKRGEVAQVHRDRALQSAQAWIRKLPNPCFITVMKSTHVYTDFNLDIPAKFVKQSKLPSTEVRVTLVSEDPPTNCKAIWKPGRDDPTKLNAYGWMNFSRTHFLEEGDVCVFEDLNTHGPAFRIGVYIFRVVELKRPMVLDWERHYHVPETYPAGAQT